MKNVFLIIQQSYRNSKDVFVKDVFQDGSKFIFQLTEDMDKALELPTSEVANAVIKSATYTGFFTNVVVRPKQDKED